MAYKANKSYQLAVKNFWLAKQYHDNPATLDEEINICIRLINQPTEEVLLNPTYRREITLAHRKRFKEVLKILLQNKFITSLSVKTEKESKSMKNLPTLKSIYLDQMNKHTEDRVYKGFVLKLTMMEDPHEKYQENLGIHTIARDDKFTYQRLAIYGYSPTRKDLLKNLGFGSKISIINPYYKMAMDGKMCIRVDDFSLVYIHNDLKNAKLCRYCGDENQKQPIQCRSCKRCYYCSKKCLKLDRTRLGHDYICDLAFGFDENAEFDY